MHELSCETSRKHLTFTGYCVVFITANMVDSCTQFSGRGWESHSPRGKWFWLREYLPNGPSWMKLRGNLIQERSGLTSSPPSR
jgi:hypothetical protein